MQKSYKIKTRNEKEEGANHTKTQKPRLLVFGNIRKYLEYLELAALAMVRKYAGIFVSKPVKPCKKKVQTVTMGG